VVTNLLIIEGGVQMTENNKINGVKVDELFSTINSIKEMPGIAKFKFRAANKWVNGGFNRTTINNFYGTQKELSHKEPFELDADEPPLLLGQSFITRQQRG
jgi:hypothetical protein